MCFLAQQVQSRHLVVLFLLLVHCKLRFLVMFCPHLI